MEMSEMRNERLTDHGLVSTGESYSSIRVERHSSSSARDQDRMKVESHSLVVREMFVLNLNGDIPSTTSNHGRSGANLRTDCVLNTLPPLRK